MEDYLTIPGQGLNALSQRWQERNATTNLLHHVQKTCLDPAKAAEITQGLVDREEKRQGKFSTSMNSLRVTRYKLAHSLTESLSYIEEHTGVFLIKPIFSRKPPLLCDLITPIARPFPVSQCNSAAVSELRRRNRPSTGFGRGAGGGSRPSTSGSNVRMIQSYLQSQRQHVDPQQLIRSINSASKFRTVSAN